MNDDEKHFDPYTGYEVKNDNSGDQMQPETPNDGAAQPENRDQTGNQTDNDPIVVGDRSYADNQKTQTGSGGSTGQKKTREISDFPVVSLILGILSIVFLCCCPGISIFVGIAAIVFACMSPKTKGRDGKATAGLICGIVSIVLSIIALIVFTVMLSSSSVQREIRKQMRDNTSSTSYYNNTSTPWDDDF